MSCFACCGDEDSRVPDTRTQYLGHHPARADAYRPADQPPKGPAPFRVCHHSLQIMVQKLGIDESKIENLGNLLYKCYVIITPQVLCHGAHGGKGGHGPVWPTRGSANAFVACIWTLTRNSPASMATASTTLLLSLSLALLAFAWAASPSPDAEAISRFQEYLRIDTAQPAPDYAAAVAFLRNQASEAGLEARTLELVAGKHLLLLRWPGRRPSLPSILLNSHTDVVPSEPNKWDHPPFSAALDEASGRIYARGSQDMKCVGMQYLEAIRRLRSAGFVPDRTIHVIFVPDEEIGGHDGVELFVSSKEFKDMNVGLVLDEGLASPGEEYRVFYAERSPWWLTIKAKGAPGHGAKLYDGSAMENLMKSVEAIRRFRTSQFDLVKSGEKAEGDVVSVNFAYLKAGTPTPTGFVMNLQPSEAEVGLDIRMPPCVHTEALERRLIEEWAPSSRNMSFEFKQRGSVLDNFGKPAFTPADSSNPWWPVFEEAVKIAGGKLGKPEVFPASTDARYFRKIGLPAFGFSPMANTAVLLHDHNEFLSKDEYIKGIGIYESIIRALATHNDEARDEESRAEL